MRLLNGFGVYLLYFGLIFYCFKLLQRLMVTFITYQIGVTYLIDLFGSLFRH